MMRRTHYSDIAIQVRQRKTFLLGGIVLYYWFIQPSDLFIRYYATAVLDYVHRSEALAEWSRLANGESVPLERALGSFDMFVLHDHYGDLLEVCLELYTE